MRKVFFRCPDGEKYEVSKCLEGCRMASRCAPRPYLKMAGEVRPWSGKASVTMLERCLRMTWLRERNDIIEDPDDSAFKIVGTKGHQELENHAKEEEFAEQFMDIGGIRGVADLVEEDNGQYVLTDYKVVGSFAVVKMAGIVQVGDRPVLDQNGEPQMFVKGPKKGTMKTEARYGIDPKKADTTNYEVQPNLYKIAWEAMNPGKVISRLQIFAIVRDGGLYLSMSRGVLKKTYLIPIRILKKEDILGWAIKRRSDIEEAMAQEILPPVGTLRETWEGRFCRDYCGMREYCAKAGDNPYLGGRGEEDAVIED